MSLFDFLLDLILEWDDIPSYEYLVDVEIPESQHAAGVHPVRWSPHEGDRPLPRYPTVDELRLSHIIPQEGYDADFLIPGESIRDALEYERYGHYEIYGGTDIGIVD